MNKYSTYFSVVENTALFTPYLEVIKDIIVDYFEKLGLFYDYENRQVVCEPQFPSPIFCRANENEGMNYDTIYITCDCSYWCQVVFQLSHELTHCFIHCTNKDRSKQIDWVEETICEAISLYFLKYFADEWVLLPLYELNHDFAESFRDYLKNELNNLYSKKLTLCQSIQELKQLNATSQEERENRRYERNQLFKLLTKENIPTLIEYRNFAVDNLLLDTVKYRQAYADNSAVSYLCYLQDKIVYYKKAVVALN